MALGLVPAMIVGIWLRVALAFSSGLWRDEAQSLAISQLPTLGDVFRFLARQDSHPPLFYLLERLWVWLFGSSDAALLALGLVPGVLIIPTAALIANRHGGERAGVLAAWYTALAWPLVWQSGDVRPYPLLSLVTLLTAAAALTAVTRKSTAAWVAYVVGCLALLYLHNWWVLVVATLGVVTCVRGWENDRRGIASLHPWLVAHGVIGLLYLPWLPTLLRQARTAGYAGPTYFPLEWVVIASIFLLGVSLSLVVPTALLLALGLWRVGGEASDGRAALHYSVVAVLPCLIALGAWTVTDLTSSYCVVALSPLTLLGLACALGRPGARTVRLRQYVAGSVMILMLGLAMSTRWYVKSNVREVAAFVSKHALGGDLVIVYPSSIGPVYKRYSSSGAQVSVFPPQAPSTPTRFSGWWESFDDAGRLTEVRERIETTCAAGRSVWLVSQWRRDDAPDSTAPLGTRERFQFGIGARLRDLRSILGAKFGPPGLALVSGPQSWRREMVDLERYAPSNGCDR